MINNNKILVTGGNGMVGNALKDIIPGAAFISSKHYDLRNYLECEAMFEKYKPELVIHLAAKVGGVRANSNFIGDFYSDNILINTNVLNCAKHFHVKKLISLLSTCVYPDNHKYPLIEENIHSGEPHYTNYGYAYAKRMLDVHSRTYRQQYGCNFITAIPNNLYGEFDNYHLENSHVIPALIRKIWEAKLNSVGEVEIWGDGLPLREFTHASDIAKILLFLLENYNEASPLNIGSTVEISIRDVVLKLCKFLDYDGKIIWDTSKLSGQYKKPSSNKKLLDLGWKKEDYTSLDDGLKRSCEWFKANYPNVRGVA
jgi:GDP-L-fucose synthase|tara:strand:- start:22586 stop:23524 length:939 start_codon:yes stop_codon:yes gene_type:complete